MNKSQGTSFGMKMWYIRSVPRCRKCRKVWLVRHERRKIGICAKCEKVNKLKNCLLTNEIKSLIMNVSQVVNYLAERKPN